MMIIWTLVFVNALMIVCLAFMPFVTRKTELFGVGIPAEETNRPELVAMRRAYRNIAVIVGLVLLALQLLFMLNPALNGGFSLADTSHLTGDGSVRFLAPFFVCLAVFIVFSFVLYLHYHRCMKSFKAAQGWRDSEGVSPVLIADTEPASKETVSLWWLLLYVAIAVATAIAVLVIWPSVPDRVATHTGLNGMPDAWADKGPGAVLPLLGSQWVLLGTFALTILIVRHAKRQIDASDPEASREQGRRFRRISSALLLFGGAALGALMGVLTVSTFLGVNPQALNTFMLVAMCLVIVVIIAVLLRVGQGGSRLKVSAGGGGRAGGTPDDDSYWKLGVIYVNRNDPSVFVEKRFGVGWTVNLGHPVSWLFLIGIIAVVVVVMVISYGSAN